MGSKFWFGTTIALSVALALAILILPPWSPLSITSSQRSNHATETPVQPASGPEAPFAVATPTPTTAPTPVPALGLGSAPPAAPTPGPKPTPTIGSIAPAEPEQQDGTGTEQPTSDPSAAISESRTGESPALPSQSLEDLIKATEDPTWKARWDAVNALGELQDSRGIPALVQRALHDDNPHPRWRSLWALKAVDLQGLQVVPALRSGLHDPDPVVVHNAAIALGFFAQPEARPELLNSLKNPDSFARWEAVFILRRVINPEVATALIPLLDEEMESVTRVRQEVALTLGSFGGDEAISALLSALRTDPSSEVRWRAALALSRIEDSSVVAELEQALPSEEDPRVREFIEDAITKLQLRQ